MQISEKKMINAFIAKYIRASDQFTAQIISLFQITINVFINLANKDFLPHYETTYILNKINLELISRQVFVRKIF